MPKLKIENYLAEKLEKHLSKTCVEVEQKYRVKSVKTIRHRLLSLGAKKKRGGYEHNELYDKDGILKKSGKRLRLRRAGEKEAWLTMKGPRQNKRHKSRMELETPVDYESTKRILELLHFRVYEAYGKRREEYDLNGNVVSLDFLPQHGWFVEIEGNARQIKKISKDLGLQLKTKEERSYRKLSKK